MLSVYVLTALLQSVGADQGRLEDVLVRSSLALALEDTSADHTQLDAAELTRGPAPPCPPTPANCSHAYLQPGSAGDPDRNPWYRCARPF